MNYFKGLDFISAKSAEKKSVLKYNTDNM